MPQVAPYGTWASPITAASVASGGVTLNGLAVSDGSVWWSEQRPSEGGRTVVVREGADVLPSSFNARTAVHEYGGGAWWVWRDTLFFANWDDQRLHRLDPGGEPVAITPEPEIPRGLRYADGVVTSDGEWIVCVRERHVSGREAFNEIVVLPSDGPSDARVICEGNDFYAFPRISPDGTKLAWTEWSHPNLPWDGTVLWVGEFSPTFGVDGAKAVAGAMDESIFQPQWSPDGVLHFVSDRSGWWNLYRYDQGAITCLADVEAEFGVPQWVFGQSQYVFLPDGDIIAAYERDATFSLGVISEGRLRPVEVPYTVMTQLVADGDRVLFLGASPAEHTAVVRLGPRTGEREVLKRSRDEEVDARYVSAPEAIAYPSEGRTAHAFFYPPTNPDHEGPPDAKPPLVVWSHGGPTGRTTSALNLALQFWTSRGFAVVDVNYGGSTGYGRDYRRLLNGNWGVVDVEDCVNAALYLAARGDVDSERLAIRGGSAGGFTTLACLTFRPEVFKAGANYFGVADMTTFVGDTHKFESRYLDSLVGPYPEKKDLYHERSPANFVDRIRCPVITLQGLEDAIVPPSQSEQIVDALRRNGIACAYVTYEGEQHGFRKAENIAHAMCSELYFYGRVFGFTPADDVEPVEIENLSSG